METMDNLLRELFGSEDKSATGTATKATETERAARQEARQRRKADPERRRKRQEFVARYSSGDPSEGFTTEEALAHLAEMREEMTPGEFRAAMKQTLEHLPPDRRDDFVALMRQHKAAHPADAMTADPFGGLLTGLVGGAGSQGAGVGELLEDLQRGGWRAPAAKPGEQPTDADFMALLNGPLGRAVLGGVAAHGIQGLEQDDDTIQRGTRTRGG